MTVLEEFNLASEKSTLLDELARSFSKGDAATLESLYAPGMVVWHNTDEREQSRSENIAVAKVIPMVFTSFTYQNIRRRSFDGGVVQQHLLCVTTRSGETCRIPVCVVAEIREGRFIRIDEYYDSAKLPAALTEALFRALGSASRIAD
jgi:ketosteroid isomerase-like protein